MLGHLKQVAMGSAVVLERFVVHCDEALRRFPFVILMVMEGFFPWNQELHVVLIA